MGPTWGPSGAGRNQMGPMLAPRTYAYEYMHIHLHSFGMSADEYAQNYNEEKKYNTVNYDGDYTHFIGDDTLNWWR